MGMDPWILEEGVKLARAITDPAGKAGFQVTLGGSVLLRGKSAKDIDLFFIPKSKDSSPAELITELEKLWGPGTVIDLKYEERSRRAVEVEEEELNARFNPQTPPRASNTRTPAYRMSSWGEATQPAPAQASSNAPIGNAGGHAVYRNGPFDTPYRGGPALPPGYMWVTQTDTGRIVAVADVGSGSDEVNTAAYVPGLGNPFSSDSTPAPTLKTKKKVEARDPFRYALMFTRKSDRIDAFIV